VLFKQTSLCEDTVETKGEHKQAHVVVKNSPFCLTFGFHQQQPHHPPYPLDLHKYTLDVKLVYDEPGEDGTEKEVDFVKSKPLVIKQTISQSGNKLTLEARIKVLTSQLEDSLFKIVMRLLDPNYSSNNNSQPQQFIASVYSCPIKVISKSDQVKKKKMPEFSFGGHKKRNIAELISESLHKIEVQQSLQTDQMSRLHFQSDNLLSRFSSTIQQQQFQQQRYHQEHQSSDEKPKESQKGAASEAFTAAFQRFLAEFGKVDAGSKYQTISRVLQQHAATDVDVFAEILDQCWAEGLTAHVFNSTNASTGNQHIPLEPHLERDNSGVPTSNTNINKLLDNNSNDTINNDGSTNVTFPDMFGNSNSLLSSAMRGQVLQQFPPCECLDCPHKKELLRIEHFYQDIFALGLTPTT